MLPILAFDGATKRNHPNLGVGALVYARISKANRHLEPELSCMAESGIKKDWMTGEAQFGLLSDGTTFECSHALANWLLEDECAILLALSQRLKFELAVGFNGWVWVNAESPAHLVVITNAILNSEHIPLDQIDAMCSNLCAGLLNKQ